MAGDSMKIGVSLPPAFLCGAAASPAQQAMLADGVGIWLSRLRDAGATHIELRAVDASTPAHRVEGAAAAVYGAGLGISVHGALADEPAERFWGRLGPVLSRQKDAVITVHGAGDRAETLRLLGRMAAYGAIHWPGARIALENSRSKTEEALERTGCAGVLAAAAECGMPNVGLCWDWGHYLWDTAAWPGRVDPLPPEGFLRRTVHTHIHSIVGGSTHFPLTAGEIPMDEYIAALAGAGYRGIWNLEPEPERWDPSWDVRDHILRSAALLRDAVVRSGI